jgi:hypothetical protein
MEENKTNIELSGKYKSTTHGKVDWYYGGGQDAWRSKAQVRSGVPNGVIREGKTVGILEFNKVVEYIWHPDDITDEGLVLKFIEGNNFEIFDSIETAYQTLGPNKRFYWSEGNFDGMPSPNNSLVGVTKE